METSVIKKKKYLPSTLSLHQLGHAMKQLDLSNIPDANKPKAIREHLTKIMADTVTDTDAKQKLRYADFRNRHNFQ
jgi:hypothetical protein